MVQHGVGFLAGRHNSDCTPVPGTPIESLGAADEDARAPVVRQCDTKTAGFSRRQPGKGADQRQPANRSNKPKSLLRRKRRLPESNWCKRLCRPLRSHSAKATRWLIEPTSGGFLKCSLGLTANSLPKLPGRSPAGCLDEVA